MFNRLFIDKLLQFFHYHQVSYREEGFHIMHKIIIIFLSTKNGPACLVLRAFALSLGSYPWPPPLLHGCSPCRSTSCSQSYSQDDQICLICCLVSLVSSGLGNDSHQPEISGIQSFLVLCLRHIFVNHKQNQKQPPPAS